MITIWGRRNSSNVQKILWCCAELGVPYERIEAGGAYGGVQESWYRAMNPNGLVPVLRDGAVVIWESNAILRYLGNRAQDERLYPSEPGARAQVDQWLDWQLSQIAPPMTTLFWGLVRVPEAERDQAGIAAAIQKLTGYWGMLDTALASRAFVAGDGLTLADLALGPQIHRWYNLPVNRPDLPHLAAWHARLQERPGFRQDVALPMT